MNESEWAATDDTAAMLNFLRGRLGEGELRLLVCRLVGAEFALSYYPSLSVAERFARGEATHAELVEARSWVDAESGFGPFEPGEECWVERCLQDGQLLDATYLTAPLSDDPVAGFAHAVESEREWREWLTREKSWHQARPVVVTPSDRNGLIRECVGNPFRPTAVDPAWLTSDVLALAAGIRRDRAFDRMPILADALQDAGCGSDQILDHCRDVVRHTEHCWVLRRILEGSERIA